MIILMPELYLPESYIGPYKRPVAQKMLIAHSERLNDSYLKLFANAFPAETRVLIVYGALCIAPVRRQG